VRLVGDQMTLNRTIRLHVGVVLVSLTLVLGSVTLPPWAGSRYWAFTRPSRSGGRDRVVSVDRLSLRPLGCTCHLT
jgi:hypothetical protein